jgi:hypothetical protein
MKIHPCGGTQFFQGAVDQNNHFVQDKGGEDPKEILHVLGHVRCSIKGEQGKKDLGIRD